MESLLARLSGRSADLLSYDSVVEKLGLRGQSSLGLQEIPVPAIVGSVGRYQDFTRTFLPRLEADEQRWINVAAAAPLVSDLPPIDVYKVGDAYFVLDGNHRVSLARQQGLDFIDAHVTEIRTRAPLPPGESPDAWIIAAEYAAFLAYTQLDNARPDADLRVSAPGQYVHLENHIEAHRYYVEVAEETEISLYEAAARWYDEAYLPLVQAVREQGILRYFPGRTETDFYVWLARHRSELENQWGYLIAPDVAVARLSQQVRVPDEQRQRTLTERLRQRLSLRPTADRRAQIPYLTWTEERLRDRYSEHLFADLLLATESGRLEAGRKQLDALLNTGLSLAAQEHARLHVLVIDPEAAPTSTRDEFDTVIRRTLGAGASAADVQTGIAHLAGDAIERTLEVSLVNDLIVLSRDFGRVGDDLQAFASVRQVCSRGCRPVLIVPETSTDAFPGHVLLLYEPGQQAPLFIAAYLAEQHGSQITVLPVGQPGRVEADTFLVPYLQLHEIDANIVGENSQPDADRVTYLAQEHGCDLIIVSGDTLGFAQPAQSRLNLADVLGRWPGAVLVAD